MSNGPFLTYASLCETMDQIRLVAYVNAADLKDPIVVELKRAGYEIEERAHMVTRRVFVRTPEKVGIVNLDTGEALLGPNPFRDCQWPKWPTGGSR